MSEGDVPLPGDNDSSGDKSKRVGSKRALSDPLLAVAPEDEEHVKKEEDLNKKAKTDDVASSSSSRSAEMNATQESKVWGCLHSLRDGAVVNLTGNEVTIGRSLRCGIVVDDSLVPSILCRLRCSAMDGVVVECLAGQMCVNATSLSKSSQPRARLSSKDQISFFGSETHAFVFQSTPDTSGAARVPNNPAFGLPNLLSSFMMPFSASTAATAMALVGDQSNVNGGGHLEGGAKKRLRPEEAEDPGAASARAAKEERLLQQERSKKQLQEEFEASIVKPEDNTAPALEDVKYRVLESTKSILLDALAVFLLDPKLSTFSALSPCIMMEGPFGTEILLTELAKAAAKHLNASCLVLDHHPILFSDSEHTAAYESDPLADPSPRDQLFSRLMKYGGSGAGGGRSSSNALSKSKQLQKGDRVRYAGDRKPLASSFEPREQRGPAVGAVGEVFLVMEDDRTVGVMFDQPVLGGVDFGKTGQPGCGYFCSQSSLRPEEEGENDMEALAVDALMSAVAAHSPCVLLIRDAEGVSLASHARYRKLQQALAKLPSRVVALGLRPTSRPRPNGSSSDRSDRVGGGGGSSSLMDFAFLGDAGMRISREDSASEPGRSMVNKLFPTRVAITAPSRNPELAAWKKSLEEDIRTLKLRNNRALLRLAASKKHLSVDVDAPSLVDLLQHHVLTNSEYRLSIAVGHAARQNGGVVEQKDDHLVIPVASLEHALRVLKEQEDESEGVGSAVSVNNVSCNDFEKKILGDVVPASELNVTFDQIGALDAVKSTLRELVLLPLNRPELFRKGNLTKPAKGVLLFGPPGTGKTMLAKAVATEGRANFINVSAASVGSKWFGEGEKYAQAIFTLASKISPCVIFIDEVDSLLGKRGSSSSEHEAMRKIKNTIFSMWDGLTTDENERVVVLAATNRPFDLDDAVLRRLPRRMMVDLPDTKQREQILEVICRSEELGPDVSLAEVARSTEGYSGSDLKNLCVAAAYVPVREVLDREKAAGLDPHRRTVALVSETVMLRALCQSDFEKARQQVSASVSDEQASMGELKQWNSMFGEGGDRKQANLSYFL